MDRRKLLLDEIRNEYKKISGKNPEGNIKKKQLWTITGLLIKP